MKRKAYRIVALAVLAALLAVPSAMAGNGNGNAKLLPLDQASALVNAPGQIIVSSVQPASAAQAAAAGLASGALTTGVVAASNPCWSGTIGYQWGTWPYQQTVYDNAYWCGNWSTMTYRTDTVTTGSTFCSSHDNYKFHIAGGIGYYSSTWTVGSYFDCPTDIPWITIHTNRAFNGVTTADGGFYRG